MNGSVEPTGPHVPYSEHGPQSVRLVHAVAEVSAIFEPSVNLVVLRRGLHSRLAEEVREAAGQPHFRRLATVTPDARGRAALFELFQGFPQLADDVQLWVEVLGDLTGCERVGVRVVRLESAMCPRFHVDKVSVRVVSTYVGSGTEYVGDEDVDRRLLGHAANGAPDEVSGLLRASARILRASAGEVAFLKGEAWPNNSGRGAVHRSPGACPDAPRLLMTLDPQG